MNYFTFFHNGSLETMENVDMEFLYTHLLQVGQ